MAVGNVALWMLARSRSSFVSVPGYLEPVVFAALPDSAALRR
ncbi:MAG: hypothetical protein QOC94_4148 [Actinoplanes sp.]|jgi:hypothetical protein|nr:hypothetical protein [Actinoplanes sp.]